MHLDLRDGLTVEDVAEELGLGQGTLLRMWVEEITRNDDFLRLFKNRVKERPETEDYMRKSAAFKNSARVVQKGTPYEIVSQRRIRCVFCNKEMSEFAHQFHLRTGCPKAPKLKALPRPVMVKIGGDMEVDY